MKLDPSTVTGTKIFEHLFAPEHEWGWNCLLHKHNWQSHSFVRPFVRTCINVSIKGGKKGNHMNVARTKQDVADNLPVSVQYQRRPFCILNLETGFEGFELEAWSEVVLLVDWIAGSP